MASAPLPLVLTITLILSSRDRDSTRFQKCKRPGSLGGTPLLPHRSRTEDINVLKNQTSRDDDGDRATTTTNSPPLFLPSFCFPLITTPYRYQLFEQDHGRGKALIWHDDTHHRAMRRSGAMRKGAAAAGVVGKGRRTASTTIKRNEMREKTTKS